jgi:hypothetical protein
MFDFLQFCIDTEYPPLVQCDQRLLSMAEIEEDLYMRPSEKATSTAVRQRYHGKIRDELEGIQNTSLAPRHDMSVRPTQGCATSSENQSQVKSWEANNNVARAWRVSTQLKGASLDPGHQLTRNRR